jgi:hypothetical protein
MNILEIKLMNVVAHVGMGQTNSLVFHGKRYGKVAVQSLGSWVMGRFLTFRY